MRWEMAHGSTSTPGGHAFGAGHHQRAVEVRIQLLNLKNVSDATPVSDCR